MTVAAFILAAAVGACCRALAITHLNTEQFPYGTMMINIGASFCLGALSSLDDFWRTIVGIGALGTLSVWSTVATEVAELARARQGLLGSLYLAATVTTGILAAWLGLQLAI